MKTGMTQVRIVSAVTLAGAALLFAPALPFAAPDWLSVASSALQQQQPREQQPYREPRAEIPEVEPNGLPAFITSPVRINAADQEAPAPMISSSEAVGPSALFASAVI